MRKNTNRKSITEITCSNCGEVAATIILDYGDKESSTSIISKGFIGTCTLNQYQDKPITEDVLDFINKHIPNNVANLYEDDRDFFGFICRVCSLPYCINCWSNKFDRSDEGFYDDTRGTCPKGHTQMISD